MPPIPALSPTQAEGKGEHHCLQVPLSEFGEGSGGEVNQPNFYWNKSASRSLWSWYCSRNALFRNFPVEVLGNVSVYTTSSGIQNLANFGRMKSRSSAGDAC